MRSDSVRVARRVLGAPAAARATANPRSETISQYTHSLLFGFSERILMRLLLFLKLKNLNISITYVIKMFIIYLCAINK